MAAFATVSAAALVVAVELMALVDAGEALRLVGQQARGAATFPDSLAFGDKDWAARLSAKDTSQGDDTTMTAVFLTGYPEALCLDGTPGAYYLRTGKSKDTWMVYFEGGGMLLLDLLAFSSPHFACIACSIIAVGRTTPPTYLHTSPIPTSLPFYPPTYLPTYLPSSPT